MSNNSIRSSRRHFLSTSASILGASTLALSPLGRLLANAGQPSGRITGYGALRPSKDLSTGLPLLELPEGFSYRTFGWTGELLDNGARTRGEHDGMGIVRSDGDLLIMVRNHECHSLDGGFAPAAATYDSQCDGGTTTLRFDAAKGEFIDARASLCGTLRNCAGGITPWGTWLSCEELVAPAGKHNVDGKKITLQRDHGFIFEVPADGLSNARPLLAMGQRKHEAACVHSASGVVYMTEDNDPAAGFYRFIPNKPGQLADGGTLQMLKAKDQPDLRKGLRTGQSFAVEWVDIDEPTRGISASGKDDGNVQQGIAAGGSQFLRLEGCMTEGDRIYFVSTSGGDRGAGQVFAYDVDKNALTVIYQSTDPKVLYYPDNLAVSPRGGLVLCQDSYRDEPQHLFGLTKDGGVFAFARNAVKLNGEKGFRGDFSKAEWAGACFSPDGRWLFVNIYNPGFTVAITGPWQQGLI